MTTVTTTWCVSTNGYADLDGLCAMMPATHTHYEVEYDDETGKVLTSAEEQERRRIAASPTGVLWHSVTGPVVGAAFTAARKAGLIRAIGFTTSDEPGTHAHPVRTWLGVNAKGAAA